MKLQWSDYGIQTFQDASDYIANNFYPEYADAFEADVFATAELLIDNPMLGVEAYPGIGRSDLRKILCKNKNWWLFYRVLDDIVEIAQVVYVRQANINPFGLPR